MLQLSSNLTKQWRVQGGCFGCWSTPHARTQKKKRRKKEREGKKESKPDNEKYLSPLLLLDGFQIYVGRPNNLRFVCVWGGGGVGVPFPPSKYRAYPFFLGIFRWISRIFGLKKGLKLLIFSSHTKFSTQGALPPCIPRQGCWSNLFAHLKNHWAYPFFLGSLWWILREFRLKRGLKLCIFGPPSTKFSYVMECLSIFLNIF